MLVRANKEVPTNYNFESAKSFTSFSIIFGLPRKVQVQGTSRNTRPVSSSSDFASYLPTMMKKVPRHLEISRGRCPTALSFFVTATANLSCHVHCRIQWKFVKLVQQVVSRCFCIHGGPEQYFLGKSALTLNPCL